MMKGTFEAKDIGDDLYFKVSDTVFSYGIGAEWALSEKFGLRADYTMSKFDPYDDSPVDVEVIALSSVYRF